MIAAIYARKSTEQGSVSDEQKSVARQIEHARAFAVKKGWTVDDTCIFVDDGISGAEFAKRPNFLRLMNALKPKPPFQVLVMSEESRLGREAIETAYALKQLVMAGVRVWFYMEDRERTLDSPIDKIMMSLTAFADELERERGRQRTYDAMLRKARAGHVTGGRLFGYENVEITGPDGQRSHVLRQPIEAEAAVIRRLFELAAAGHGIKAIARQLNDEGALSPEAQRNRSKTWAPSSVREALRRDSYRGLITWNRTKKRNQWGAHHQTDRPAVDWVQVPAPDLRIVSDDLWTAAHRKMAAAVAIYTGRSKHGARPVMAPSKYLLTNLLTCGVCGGNMHVRSHKSGAGRRFFYACSGYHLRGRTVCGNKADIPMVDTDDTVIEALLDDVLDPVMLNESIDEGLRVICDPGLVTTTTVDAELAAVDRECERLAAAIAAGGEMTALLDALRARRARRSELERDREALTGRRLTEAGDAVRIRSELTAIAHSWRQVLAYDPGNARPIVTTLASGRVRITPLDVSGRPGKEWELSGEANLAGLFERSIVPMSVASPPGFEPGFQP